MADIRTALLVFSAALAAPYACQKEKPQKAAAEKPAPSVAKPEKPPEKPWFVGTWRGSYAAKPHSIEKQLGGLAEWEKREDAGGPVGSGTLEIEIKEDGVAVGSGHGPLGKLKLSGELEAEALNVRLVSEEHDPAVWFSGYLSAKRSEDKLVGRLVASGHNSRHLRKAEVELARVEPN